MTTRDTEPDPVEAPLAAVTVTATTGNDAGAIRACPVLAPGTADVTPGAEEEEEATARRSRIEDVPRAETPAPAPAFAPRRRLRLPSRPSSPGTLLPPALPQTELGRTVTAWSASPLPPVDPTPPPPVAVATPLTMTLTTDSGATRILAPTLRGSLVSSATLAPSAVSAASVPSPAFAPGATVRGSVPPSRPSGAPGRPTLEAEVLGQRLPLARAARIVGLTLAAAALFIVGLRVQAVRATANAARTAPPVAASLPALATPAPVAPPVAPFTSEPARPPEATPAPVVVVASTPKGGPRRGHPRVPRRLP